MNKLTYLPLCTALAVIVSLSGCASVAALNPWSDKASNDRPLYNPDDLETISINGSDESEADELESLDTVSVIDDVAMLPTAAGNADSNVTLTYPSENIRYPAYQTQFTYAKVDAYTDRLFMQLHQRAPRSLSRQSIAVVNFVKFDQSLKNVTLLGQHITEYLMQEGQRLGYQIIDHKADERITQSSKGDTVFDYFLSHHADEFDAVLAGTMVSTPTGIRVHARIIATDSQQMLSSGEVFIPKFIVDQLPHVPLMSAPSPDAEAMLMEQTDLGN